LATRYWTGTPSMHQRLLCQLVAEQSRTVTAKSQNADGAQRRSTSPLKARSQATACPRTVNYRSMVWLAGSCGLSWTDDRRCARASASAAATTAAATDPQSAMSEGVATPAISEGVATPAASDGGIGGSRVVGGVCGVAGGISHRCTSPALRVVKRHRLSCRRAQQQPQPHPSLANARAKESEQELLGSARCAGPDRTGIIVTMGRPDSS
jgi:hypothetical protein